MTTTKSVEEIVSGLFPYGEWNDDATVKAADLLGELVRYLNHATREAASLPAPVTVANTLTSLGTVLQRLPQLLGQLAARERQFAGDPDLRLSSVPDGGPMEPGAVAEWAAIEMEATVTAIESALSSLKEAVSPANRLYLDGPDDEEDKDDPGTPDLRALFGQGQDDSGFRGEVVRMCRIALREFGGRPSGAWSTGEQLAVALVLRNEEHLESMGYTPVAAMKRVAGGMYTPPEDLFAWMASIRAELELAP